MEALEVPCPVRADGEPSGVQTVADADGRPPAVGGRFRLHDEIARGAMGAVYRATDLEDGSSVAVKVPTVAPSSLSANEGDALSAIATPSVPRRLAKGDGDQPFLAMELVEGEPLLERLRASAPFPPAIALATARRAAAALAAVHLTGWVHQDVKPGNFVLGRDGSLRLVDFGLASPVGGASVGISGRGWVGTPGYLAPEQLSVPCFADPRADVFALGCLVFESFVGRKAFQRTLQEISAGDWSVGRHPALDTGALPGPMQALVRDMTAVSASERPADALEVLIRLMTLDPTVGGRLEGRLAPVAACVRSAYGGGAVVRGAPGSGTTSTALGAACVLAEILAPCAVILVRCNPRARRVPGGHGTRLAPALRAVGLGRIASFLQGRPITVDVVTPRPELVIVLDDLPFCDSLTMGRLRVLAALGLVRIVGTARPGAPVDTDLDTIEMEETVEAAVATGALGVKASRTLGQAALFGTTFDVRAVAQLGGPPEIALTATCEHLEREGTLRRVSATAWSFARTSAWEAALRGVAGPALGELLRAADRVNGGLPASLVEVCWIRRASGACHAGVAP